MRLSFRKLEYAWHTLAFVLLMGAFVPLWRQMATGGIDPGEGDPVQRVFLGVAYLGVGLLIFHPRRSARVARRGWLIWALVGWAMLSTLWSVAPAITFRRSLAATLGAFYGLLLAVRYKPEEVLRILGVALGIVVVASLLAIAVVPDWAVMKGLHEGAWRGVLIHKNALGRLGAFAVLTFIILWKGKYTKKRFLWILLSGAAFILVLGSRSASGIILLSLVIVGGGMLFLWQRLPSLLQTSLGFFVLAVLIPVIMFLPEIVEATLSLLGKDITLTGRIPLWLLLIPFVLQRPLLGYGYGAFWRGEEGPSAAIWAIAWNAAHAHNGYLNLWLETGLVGMSLGLLVSLLPLAKSLKKENMQYAPFMNLVFLFVVFFVLFNSVESVLMEYELGKAIYWVFISYFVHAVTIFDNYPSITRKTCFSMLKDF